MEAPDGRKVDDPSGPPERFQPGPAASADPSPPGFRPDVSGKPAQDARSVTEDHRRALPARPPLSHVSVAGRTSSPRQGEDQYAGGLNAAAPV